MGIAKSDSFTFLLRIKFTCKSLCLFKVDLNSSGFGNDWVSLGSNGKKISCLHFYLDSI